MRKLSVAKQILVASPELLIRYGTPNSPDDLNGMPFVGILGIADQLRLRRGKETEDIEIQNCQIETNNIYGAQSAAEGSLGVASLPMPLCERAIYNGSLIQVIPQWELPDFSINAIWPDTSRRSSLTKRLVEHIVVTVKDSL